MEDDSDRFRVAVKASATEANEATERLAERRGRIAVFDSRADAVERAGRLSAEGSDSVEIQAAAPRDPADVDAYLVAKSERRHRDPDGSLAEGLTFDTTATQFGALGEALVCSQTVNPPVLTYFARRDVDVSDDAELRVELDADPDPVVADGASGRRWEPDCEATVLVGADRRRVREYYCEIKTGDGSFERSQRDIMEAKAREATVLGIRVDVTDLPDSYTARIRAVEPDEADAATFVDARRTNSRLDDFG